MSNKRNRSVLLFLVAFLAAFITFRAAFAGRGTVTISSVTANGDGSYNLTVSSTTGMTVGDHFGARITNSTGPGGLWRVESIGGATACVVSENTSLYAENGGAFGTPVVGDAWYSTPTTQGLSRPPHLAKSWDAALRRDHYLVGSLGLLSPTATANNFLVANGTTWASTTPSNARTALGVVIGTDVQAYDAQLADVAGLTPTDNNFIVGNGTNFVAESGATARTSMGAQASHARLDDVSAVGVTNGSIVAGNGSNLTLQTLTSLLDGMFGSTQGNILHRTGAAWTVLAPGTSGQVLHTNGGGANVSWDTDDGAAGSAHDMMSATHTDSAGAGAGGKERGDVMIVGSSTTWTRLPHGATNTVMGWDGTDMAHRTLSAVMDGALGSSSGKVAYRDGSGWTVTDLPTGTVLPATADGRLTISSTASVSTNTPASTTLYYLPHVGQKVAVYDGSSTWSYLDIGSSGVSITNSGLTAAQNYDVWIYSSGGTPTLELSVWNTHTAGTNERINANAPTRQNGVWVKTGATTRRYLGTIRTKDDGGTVKFYDQMHYRLVWNVQNRVPVRDISTEDANGPWSPSGVDGTWAAINGGDADWTHNFVVGLEQEVAGQATYVAKTNTTIPSAGIAINSTTSFDFNKGTLASNDSTALFALSAHFSALAPAGYNYLQGVETSNSTGGTQALVYGDNTANPGGGVMGLQAGMTYVGER